MPTPPLSREKMQAALDAYLRHDKCITDAAASLNIPRQTLAGRLRKAMRAGLHTDYPAAEGREIRGTSTIYDKDGNVRRTTVHERDESAVDLELPDGRLVGVSTLRGPDGSIVHQWEKRAPGVPEYKEVIQQIIEGVNAAPPVPAPDLDFNADLRTFLLVPDVHWNMRTHAAECGEGYDMDKARARLENAVQRLIPRTPPCERMVIAVLGDFFHANDHMKVTPKSKHRMDTDRPQSEASRAAIEAVAAMAHLALQRHHHVDLVVSMGNHDPDAAQWLAIALEQRFRDEPRVTVEVPDDFYQFQEFGNNYVCLHHGHGGKFGQLAPMVSDHALRNANGRPEWRYLWVGHGHHKEGERIGGVDCEMFDAICPLDDYAATHAYVGRNAMTAVTLHAEGGEDGRTIQPIRG